MRRFLSRLTVLSVLLTLGVAGVAWAHVTVSPEEVSPGDFETLTLNVPTEKEIPTTEVRVEVPEDFTVSGVQPVPGWEHEFEEQGGVTRAIVWSGGEIGAREFQQFLISAQTPEEAGEYAWPATQTYQDGSVVEWTGPPDSDNPASVIQVASSGSEGGHGAGAESGNRDMGGMEAGSQASASAPLPDTGGISPVLYVGFGAAATVLGAALIMRLRRIG